jgi:hypothetical protein
MALSIYFELRNGRLLLLLYTAAITFFFPQAIDVTTKEEPIFTFPELMLRNISYAAQVCDCRLQLARYCYCSIHSY